jgi:hypothetical protein
MGHLVRNRQAAYVLQICTEIRIRFEWGGIRIIKMKEIQFSRNLFESKLTAANGGSFSRRSSFLTPLMRKVLDKSGRRYG